MYKFIGLYILAILGIFIDFSLWGSLGNIFFKILVFGSISYLMFTIWQEIESGDDESDESDSAFQQVEFPEKEKPVFEIQTELTAKQFRENKDLNDFLKRQFETIWNFILPGRGFIFFLGWNQEPYIIHSQAGVQLEEIPTERLKSFLSVIDKVDGILVENNIHPAENMIPFLSGDIYIPKSMLAFTSVIAEDKKLYWIFDSDVENHFNKDDNSALELINQTNLKTIELIARSVDINNELKLTKNLLELSSVLNTAEDYDNCQEIFTDKIIKSFEASKFTIALKNPDSEHESAIIKKSIGIDDPYKYGFEFLLEEGLNGWVILKNKPYLIDNIDKGDYFIPRFTREEKTNYDLRCFLSVPITGSDSEAVGMVTLEHKEINKYNSEDKRKLSAYTEIFSNAIHRFFDTEENKQ